MGLYKLPDGYSVRDVSCLSYQWRVLSWRSSLTSLVQDFVDDSGLYEYFPRSTVA